MPYTIKTQQIAVKDPDTGEYSGVDVLAEQTTEGLLNEIKVAGTNQVTNVQNAGAATVALVNNTVSQSQTAVDNLQQQRDDIVTSVTDTLSKGVDNSLTMPSMPAEAKAVGDLYETIVVDSETQPNKRWNRVWVKPATEEVEIPTMDDINEIDSAMRFEDEEIVLDNYPIYNCAYRDSGLFSVSGTSYRSVQVPIHHLFSSFFFESNETVDGIFTFLKETLPSEIKNSDNGFRYICDGEPVRHVLAGGQSITYTIPNDAKYVLIAIETAGTLRAPEKVILQNSILNKRFLNNESIINTKSVNESYNFAKLIVQPGGINITDGSENNIASIASLYKRSEYIYMSAGTKLMFSNMYAITNISVLSVYDLRKQYVFEQSKPGIGQDNEYSTIFIMPFDGYIRFCTKLSTIELCAIHDVTSKKPLNILVLGNSFSQDSFAYLPPVLNELLSNYLINYGVAYSSSYGALNHVDSYNNNIPYTWFNMWRPYSKKWKRYANEKTLADIAQMEKWNVVYFQSRGSVSENELYTNNIVPGRKLLRILQSLLDNNFIYLTGQWLIDNEHYDSMRQAMTYIEEHLGVNGIIPIGAAIANARTNDTFANLGNSGNMLYDNQHQQGGLPALMSTYVVAEYMLKLLGEEQVSVYNSTFIPSTENCVDINVAKENGDMTTPLPMTHGPSVGVNDDNIKAAQELAIAAFNRPNIIMDCSDIISV